MDPASDECVKLFAPVIKLCFGSMLLKKKYFIAMLFLSHVHSLLTTRQSRLCAALTMQHLTMVKHLTML